MKNAFILILIMHSCSQSTTDTNRPFSINIWNYDYSLAYTIHYKINNDSLIINSISGVQNESGRTLLSKRLSINERSNMCRFLSSFPLNSLKNNYKDSLVEDGDQKKVEIAFNSKIKTIELSNFYQKDIGSLFNVVNHLLEKDMQIEYKK